MKKTLAAGPVHAIPRDLRDELLANTASYETWQDITPLARNEWICWVESAKLAETRAKRIQRIHSMFLAGKRRPCCWPGCTHREKTGS